MSENIYDWNVVVADAPDQHIAELIRDAVREAFAGRSIAAKKLGGPVMLDSSRISLPYTKGGPHKVIFRWVRAPDTLTNDR